jgi:hypothetical protein
MIGTRCIILSSITAAREINLTTCAKHSIVVWFKDEHMIEIDVFHLPMRYGSEITTRQSMVCYNVKMK